MRPICIAPSRWSLNLSAPHCHTSLQTLPIHRHCSSTNQGLRFLTVARVIHNKPDSMAGKDEGDQVCDQSPQHDQPQVSPPTSTFTTWPSWVLGSIMTILLPFWKIRLRTIEATVEVAAEDVEEVAEDVEKVANVVEKVSEDIANRTPEDGPLKETALFAESVSKLVVKEAHTVEQIVHTVEELKEEVDTLVDPAGTEGKDAAGHN